MADTSTEVTPIEIDDLYEMTELTYTAATETDANDTEDMWWSVPAGRRGIQRILVFLQEGGNDSDFTAEFLAGDHWAASAKSVTVTQNKTKMVELETARHLDSDGKIHCVLTPDTGKILLTNEAAAIAVVYLY